MEFMPRFAPLVTLGFLMLGFSLAVEGAAFIYAAVAGKKTLARILLAGALGELELYFGFLVVVSLLSQEKVLRPGEWKYFCEMDCHEAYSIVDVKPAKMLGNPPRQAVARGTFYLATVRVWFDEQTISSHRAREVPLTPNPRVAYVVDGLGRRYGVSQEGQAALEQAQGKGLPFATPLRPSESYTTTLVFDLPSGIPNPRLYITTEPAMTFFLVGHENSPFHKRVLFALEPVARAERRKGQESIRDRFS